MGTEAPLKSPTHSHGRAAGSPEHFAERLRLHTEQHNVSLRDSFAIVVRHPDAKSFTESGRFIAVQYSCLYAIGENSLRLRYAKKNATEFPGAEDG